MLEVSLSLVAGFAAFTAYVIAGDDIRANRNTPLTALKQPVTPKAPGKPTAKAPKPVAAPSTKATASKAKPTKAKAKTKTQTDPLAATANAIMRHLTENGPATITKLSNALKLDAASILLTAEKLVKDNKAKAIKRGGYPALALND